MYCMTLITTKCVMSSTIHKATQPATSHWHLSYLVAERRAERCPRRGTHNIRRWVKGASACHTYYGPMGIVMIMVTANHYCIVVQELREANAVWHWRRRNLPYLFRTTQYDVSDVERGPEGNHSRNATMMAC